MSTEALVSETTAPAPRIYELHTSAAELVESLRQIPQLAGLTDQEFFWLATHGTERFAEQGAVVFREGEPATTMNIIIEGEVQVRRNQPGQSQLFIGRSGQITGLLPFSRMKAYGGDGSTTEDTWVLDIPNTLFPEMLREIPSMAERSVAILLDRVREVTRLEQQAEKLQALGKLAANLSHELNNPASAAQRSAAGLLDELRVYGMQKFQLGRLCLDEQTYEELHQWHQQTREISATQVPSTPLEQSEREESVTQWLVQRQVAEPWKTAPALAEAGVAVSELERLKKLVRPDLLGPVLTQFASSLRAQRMTQAVLDSTARIFDLIRAIKDYSYMDQVPLQDIDVAQGLESTLAMLGSRLAKVKVIRDYDPDLPRIAAYGSELNQVWTALLENALDAIQDEGEIRLKTSVYGELVTVEIWDNGPGIPVHLMNRIYEPFFTTKAPGKGLGLGLDIAMRIVRKHRGFLKAESRPGATCFQVRLPRELAGAY